MRERVLRGQCADCKHEWIVAYLPMKASLVATLAKNARCPSCAAGCVNVWTDTAPDSDGEPIEW